MILCLRIGFFDIYPFSDMSCVCVTKGNREKKTNRETYHTKHYPSVLPKKHHPCVSSTYVKLKLYLLYLF